MALETNLPVRGITTQQTVTTNHKDAEGWLNLKIEDANGNEHNIRCFIPLTSENALHRALINKAKNGTGDNIALIGSVNLATDHSVEINLL